MIDPTIPRTWTEAEADAYWRKPRPTLREHAVAEVASHRRFFAVDLGERLGTTSRAEPISERHDLQGRVLFDLAQPFQMEAAIQAVMQLHREIDRRVRMQLPGSPPPWWKDPEAPDIHPPNDSP